MVEVSRTQHLDALELPKKASQPKPSKVPVPKASSTTTSTTTAIPESADKHPKPTDPASAKNAETKSTDKHEKVCYLFSVFYFSTTPYQGCTIECLCWRKASRQGFKGCIPPWLHLSWSNFLICRKYPPCLPRRSRLKRYVSYHSNDAHHIDRDPTIIQGRPSS